MKSLYRHKQTGDMTVEYGVDHGFIVIEGNPVVVGLNVYIEK